MYPSEPSSGSSRGPLLLALGGLVVLGLVAVLVVALAGGGDDEPGTGSTTTTTATGGSGGTTGTTGSTGSTDTTGGAGTPAAVSDTELQALQDSCEGDEMRDCDALWLLSPPDSDFETFAETCGSRDSAGGHEGTCYDDFPDAAGNSIGMDLSDEALERLRVACDSDFFGYCDMLFWKSPPDSELEAFAESCGGEAPEGQPHAGTCQEALGPSASTSTTTS